MRRLGSVLLAAVGVLSAACSADTSAHRSPALQPPPIVQQPDNPSLPYGITAIDYHFHDTHPSLPLMTDRTVLWTNQGQVRHNVSIPGLQFSRDIAPGEGFQIKALGRKLGGPGVYTFYCRFHEALGMTGVIVIRGRGPSSIPTVPASLLPPSYSPIPIASPSA